VNVARPSRHGVKYKVHTFSLEPEVSDAIDSLPPGTKSDVVNRILRENLHRIGEKDLVDKELVEEQNIKLKVYEMMLKEYEKALAMFKRKRGDLVGISRDGDN